MFISDNDSRIVYTCDTAPIEDLPKSMYHPDLLIHETNSLSENRKPDHSGGLEAAALAEVAFSINIVMSTNGKHSAFFCGKLHEAWLESCMYQRRNYEKPIDYRADVVVLSSGGAPKDMNLYQGFKALKNAVNCVKEGGEAIWLCKCPEGCGAPDYSSWLQPLLEGHLDESLRKEFTIGGFIFYLTVESLGQIKCRIMSEMGNDIVQPMGAVGSYKSVEALLEGVDFTGKTVYVMPQAGNVLPMYKKD